MIAVPGNGAKNLFARKRIQSFSTIRELYLLKPWIYSRIRLQVHNLTRVVYSGVDPQGRFNSTLDYYLTQLGTRSEIMVELVCVSS